MVEEKDDTSLYSFQSSLKNEKKTTTEDVCGLTYL
jgi:hypothetical protein